MTAFDLSEIKSPKGYLKLFQALINLIGAVFSFASIFRRPATAVGVSRDTPEMYRHFLKKKDR